VGSDRRNFVVLYTSCELVWGPLSQTNGPRTLATVMSTECAGSVGRERRSPSRTSSFGVPGGNLCVVPVGCSIHSSGRGWRCSTHMFLSYVRRQLTWRRSCSVEQSVSEVRLTSWDRLPSGAALVDDAMSVASDDLSVVSESPASSAESQSGRQQYLFQKQGCYAVARFLGACQCPSSCSSRRVACHCLYHLSRSPLWYGRP
jgi:hypothetical protein